MAGKRKGTHALSTQLRSIAMDACVSLSCCVCTADLQASAQSRRIINPVSRANVRERALFLRFVRPGFQFSVEGVSYVCQHTCFNKLKRAANYLATFQSLISDLCLANQVDLYSCLVW